MSPFHQLPEILQETCQMLQQIDDKYCRINSGGCGAAAAIIGRCLSQMTRVRIAVRTYEEPCDSIDNIRENVNRYNSKPSIDDWYDYGSIDFNHVWVEFEWAGVWYSVDTEALCEGECVDDYGEPYKERITLNDITMLASNPAGWNRMFDRDQIPDIERDILEGFGRVFNQKFH